LIPEMHGSTTQRQGTSLRNKLRLRYVNEDG
jgi:hypothetical protein